MTFTVVIKSCLRLGVPHGRVPGGSSAIDSKVGLTSSNAPRTIRVGEVHMGSNRRQAKVQPEVSSGANRQWSNFCSKVVHEKYWRRL